MRLAQLAELKITDARLDTLAEMNAYNIEGRYPESLTAPPSRAEAKEQMEQAEEIHSWLMSLLS